MLESPPPLRRQFGRPVPHERRERTIAAQQLLLGALGWLFVLAVLAAVGWYVWATYEFGQALKNLPG
jgi:hypothetical protein